MTLPPGRARLATRPVPTGSAAVAKTIGMTDVACFAARTARSRRDNDIDLEPDELGRDLGEALAASLRPAILDRDGATLDPAEFAQPLHKSGDPWARSRRRGRAQEPDGRQLRRLLRARRERPRRRRAAEQRDELAPPHRAHPRPGSQPSIAGLVVEGGVHRSKKRRLMSELGSIPLIKSAMGGLRPSCHMLGRRLPFVVCP